MSSRATGLSPSTSSRCVPRAASRCGWAAAPSPPPLLMRVLGHPQVLRVQRMRDQACSGMVTQRADLTGGKRVSPAGFEGPVDVVTVEDGNAPKGKTPRNDAEKSVPENE